MAPPIYATRDGPIYAPSLDIAAGETEQFAVWGIGIQVGSNSVYDELDQLRTHVQAMSAHNAAIEQRIARYEAEGAHEQTSHPQFEFVPQIGLLHTPDYAATVKRCIEAVPSDTTNGCTLSVAVL